MTETLGNKLVDRDSDFWMAFRWNSTNRDVSFLLKGAFRQSTEGGRAAKLRGKKGVEKLTIDHPQHRDGGLNRGWMTSHCNTTNMGQGSEITRQERRWKSWQSTIRSTVMEVWIEFGNIFVWNLDETSATLVRSGIDRVELHYSICIDTRSLANAKISAVLTFDSRHQQPMLSLLLRGGWSS